MHLVIFEKKTNSCWISLRSIADHDAITEQTHRKSQQLVVSFSLVVGFFSSFSLSEMFDLFKKIVDGCGRKTSVRLSSLVSSGFHQIFYSTLILPFFHFSFSFGTVTGLCETWTCINFHE